MSDVKLGQAGLREPLGQANFLGGPTRRHDTRGTDAPKPSASMVRSPLLALARWALANGPVLVFLCVYVSTCLVGALLFVAKARTFVRLYEYFSGTKVPSLTASQRLDVVLLLCVAPLLIWLGFALARRMPLQRVGGERIARGLGNARLESPSWFPRVVFGLSAAIASFSITRAGALAHVSSWLDYRQFVSARAGLFGSLHFIEFANIYMFLPFSAAWVLLTPRGSGVRGLILRWVPLAFTEVVDLLLYQKKTAIVSLLIVVFAWVLTRGRDAANRRRAAAGAWAVLALGFGVYMATVVVPVYSKSSSATVCLSQGNSCHSAVPAIVMYAALSPLTRTSAPALYYPIVYPHEHAFYGLDVFQDFLRLPSHFPDDNKVIWHRQNPGLPGTSAAPFQFSLYSGVGVPGALVESFVIGLIMGLGWRLVLSDVLPRVWRGLLGSAQLTFGLYIAIDSFRNDTTVSYGILWGLTFIILAGLCVHILNGVRATFGRGSVAALAIGLAVTSFRQALAKRWQAHVVSQRRRIGAAALVFAPIVIGVVAFHASRSQPSKVYYLTNAPAYPVLAYSAAYPPVPGGGATVRRWDFGNGVPAAWHELPGVRVRQVTGGARITTNAMQNYQLVARRLTLGPGAYVLDLIAQLGYGGVGVGALDERTVFIAQRLYGGGETPSPFRELGAPFAVRKPTSVQVVLSNVPSAAGRTSTWVVRSVELRRQGPSPLPLISEHAAAPLPRLPLQVAPPTPSHGGWVSRGFRAIMATLYDVLVAVGAAGLVALVLGACGLMAAAVLVGLRADDAARGRPDAPIVRAMASAGKTLGRGRALAGARRR